MPVGTLWERSPSRVSGGREREPVSEGPWAGVVWLIHGLSRVMDSTAC